jgi:glycosyltransferase involved in cell wall biosynthesis
MTDDSPRRRLAESLRWRWQRHRLRVDADLLRSDARSLGFPEPLSRRRDRNRPTSDVELADPGPRGPRPPAAASATSAGPPGPPPAGPEGSAPRGSFAAATVCTLDHLHFALALAASLRRHEPGIPLFILVVDGDGVELPTIDGCIFLRGSEVGLFDDLYLALKFSAMELCCAAKPFLLEHVAGAAGGSVVVYLDADIYLFAPIARLLDAASRSDFVVFPHTFAPMPRPDLQWERPTLGQLAFAGVLNAGLFAFRVGGAARRFLATWRELVTEPGAFLESRGAQTEQNAFNWVVAFADDVRVLRDAAYNVAYWNLHERSLRWDTTTTEGPAFTVDGEPLVAFHFSGYLPDDPSRLSVGDRRNDVHCDRSLARLLAFYSEELTAQGMARVAAAPYRFAEFPSGVPLDRRMRRIFKEYEVELRRELDPFTPEGEAHYCRALLSPLAGGGSLLPILLADIYRERSDLRAFLPEAELDPEPLLRWFSRSGIHEMPYGDLFDRHRCAVPKAEGLRLLAAARSGLPEIFATCAEPLGRDRRRLIANLEAAEEVELAQAIRDLDVEYYAGSPLLVVWRLVRERPDLRQAFPDLLDRDAEEFASWLRSFGVALDLLDRETPERFASAARGGALARIFLFLDRSPELAREWPLALVGERSRDFARLLLAHLQGCPEYDLDDVVMYLWLMDERPWSGVPLVLELRVNAARSPSSLLDEGQEALLAPLLAESPEFVHALADFRRRHGPLPASEAARLRSTAVRSPGSPIEPGERRPGINLFGYFRSPIGLGYQSKGLALALRLQGVEVQENLIGNMAMEPGLRPSELVRRYDFRLDTNLFVTFPHLGQRLLDTYPGAWVGSRRNVVYLAWEQREANPLWESYFRGFDQVWTLSTFAARGLEEALGREVRVVPCAVDVAALELAVRRARLRGEKRERTFEFLSTFDANSSIERKNPEATVAAFAHAFRPGEAVTLNLRIANAQNWPHRRRLRRLAELAAATGLDIRLLTAPLSRAEYLGLLVDADGYLSLHRAEGFGMTCAEAMALGIPTIATGYSGNTDFMAADNSFLVESREIEVRVAEGPFRGGSLWAEPDVEHAAALMRWVYENRAAATAIAERGRATVLERLTPAAVGAVAVAALAR